MTFGSSGWKGLNQMPIMVGCAEIGVVRASVAAAANRSGVLLGIVSPDAAIGSDALAFDRLGQLLDAVADPVDIRVDRLGLAISVQRVRLIVVLLQDRTELGECHEVLWL